MIEFKNKEVLVLGLGVSGFSAAKLLAGKGALVKISEAARDETISERIKKVQIL